MLKRGRAGIPSTGQADASCLPPMHTAEGREAAAALDRLAAAIDAILDKCSRESETTPLVEDTTSVAIGAPLTLALLCLKLQSKIAEPSPAVKALCDQIETALQDNSRFQTHHAVRMICQLTAMQSDTVAHKLDLVHSCAPTDDNRPH